ncbi:MAG: NAD(P)-binding domain-containing protein, partial [Pseudomonadota bacterium]
MNTLSQQPKKIGMIGLGKLGLPCAVAMAHKGLDVMGYDINPANMSKDSIQYQETGPDGVSPFNPWLESATLQFGSLSQVADHADVIFLAVQTPHDHRFEGTVPIPEERQDFDYSYLVSAVKELAKHVKGPTPVV